MEKPMKMSLTRNFDYHLDLAAIKESNDFEGEKNVKLSMESRGFLKCNQIL